MKKILLFCLLLSPFINIFSQTSVYKPLPESNAVWTVNYGGYQMMCLNYNYFYLGDTTVNSKVYHNVIQQGKEYADKFSTCDYYFGQFYNYHGAIRQDISAKKVFYLPPDSTNEMLLYDFSLGVGDTLFSYYLTRYDGGEPFPLVVDSIDSVMVGTQYHKRFNFVDTTALRNPSAPIIEGMGGLNGLFEALMIFESGGTLSCFSANNQTLYPNYSSIEGCEMIVGVENFNENVNIFLFPNPTNNFFIIDFPFVKDYCDMVIYDAVGREVLSKQKVYSKENIDVSTIPQGILIVKVFYNNQIFYSKLVKQ